MGKNGAKFSNQKNTQIIKHLEKLLRDDKLYNLTIDPIGIYFVLEESVKQTKEPSEKQIKIRKEYENSSKKKRKLSGTRRRSSPKIRSVKKGRTVNLKGVSY